MKSLCFVIDPSHDILLTYKWCRWIVWNILKCQYIKAQKYTKNISLTISCALNDIEMHSPHYAKCNSTQNRSIKERKTSGLGLLVPGSLSVNPKYIEIWNLLRFLWQIKKEY